MSDQVDKQNIDDAIGDFEAKRAAFDAKTDELARDISATLDKLERDLALHEQEISSAEAEALDEADAAYINYIAATIEI